MIPGGIGEATHILRGKLTTAITKYPTGKYGLVGNIPGELTREYTSGFTTGRCSIAWETEQDVIDALLKAGITKFQRADCSWWKD